MIDPKEKDMPEVEETITENLPVYTSGPAFIVRATWKGLEILYGILVTARGIHDVLKDIRNIQSCSGDTLGSDEAEKVLGVSKNKLKSMRKKGVLIEGTHYRQDEGVIRFHPDVGRLFITHAPNNITNECTEASEALSYAEKQAGCNQTRNAFKGE